MSQFSDYLENAIGEHFLRNSAQSAGLGYLALYTSSPGDDNSGNEVDDPASNSVGYAREVLTFAAFSGGQASTTTLVEFTATGGNWGNITHVAIFDAATGGNLLYHGSITSAVINDGDTLRFPIGSVTVQHQ